MRDPSPQERLQRAIARWRRRREPPTSLQELTRRLEALEGRVNTLFYTLLGALAVQVLLQLAQLRHP